MFLQFDINRNKGGYESATYLFKIIPYLSHNYGLSDTQCYVHTRSS